MAEIQPRQRDREHRFSDEFMEKMALLIKKEKRKRSLTQTLRRAAAIFMAIILGAGLWLGVDTEARADFKQWLCTKFENSLVFQYFGKSSADKLPEIKFGWLPKGYAETESIIQDGIGHYLFSNSEGKTIALGYEFMDPDVSFALIMDENITCETVDINGVPAYLYVDQESDNSSVLWWADEEAGIAFDLNAQLGWEDMIRLAENVELNFS